MAKPLQTDFPSARIVILDEPLLRTGCKLGEGPIWDTRTQTLHFIDIDNPHLYHYDTKTRELSKRACSDTLGCLALRPNGQLACAARYGYGLINESQDGTEPVEISYLKQPLSEEQMKYTRFNDGACDARGRFWAGTLECITPEGNHIPGQLWRYDPEIKEAKMIDDRDITDSNGIGWTKDHKTMYFVNSTINVIYAYDYDIETGEATNRRTFVDEGAIGMSYALYGHPDGLCLDSEGRIWSARWKGSRVVRFAADGKSIDLEVHIPKAYNVTACCFGGPNMDKLYITTASPFANREYSDDVNADRSQHFPYSGDVFVLDLANLPEAGQDLQLPSDIGNAEWRHMFAD